MRYTVTADAISSAPPEVVFEHIARAEAWALWAGFSRSERERPGTGEPNGVGSIRRLTQGPARAREETVAYEPYRHYAYRLLSGLPIDYRADVTLEPTADGGTAIRWVARFSPRLPGTGPAFRLLLTRVLHGTATKVARHAEGCRPGCPAHPAA